MFCKITLSGVFRAMVHSHLPVEIDQLRVWLGPAVEHAQSKPGELFAIVLGVALVCFTIKQLVTSSYYHNIDGPAAESFLYGTWNPPERMSCGSLTFCYPFNVCDRPLAQYILPDGATLPRQPTGQIWVFEQGQGDFRGTFQLFRGQNTLSH